jgi:hypothetical protein
MILGQAEDKRPELSEPERQTRGRVFGAPGVSLRSIPTGYSAPRAGQDWLAGLSESIALVLHARSY